MDAESPGERGLDVLRGSTFLHGANAAYVETLYARYAEDPAGIAESWRKYFSELGDPPETARAAAEGPAWKRPGWPVHASGEWVAALDGDWSRLPAAEELDGKIRKRAAKAGQEVSGATVQQATVDSIRALMLIRAYRIRGHLVADLDPLKLWKPHPHPSMDPAHYGFGEGDMDRDIYLDHVLGLESATLREILELVKRTYCGTFALQYMHISSPEAASWLRDRIEGLGKEVSFTRKGRLAILRKLIEAEGFETFLGKKYVGTKRFGLDGAESLVPAMEQIIKRGGALGVEEIVIGMPHRGRLNVLANVMSKPYQAIFHEFRGGSSTPEEVEGSGDVKYHLGSSADRTFDGNEVHLSLTANPSHLEAVDPVVLGKSRAKQDQLDDEERTRVMPLLLHGDAAFAGQGVVAECFGLSGLRGTRTGGAIHIIVNNQIGFTTAPHNSRSSPYPSDIALMVECPIFHVNGDDPEAVVHAAKVAAEYRQRFGRDVVIDMFCYRRFGHNEGDEPMFTQPLMYRNIRARPSTLQIYGDRLIAEGVISKQEFETEKREFAELLEEAFEASAAYRPNKADWLDGAWSGIGKHGGVYQRGDTGVETTVLHEVGDRMTRVPEEIKLHRTVARVLEGRRKAVQSGTGIDWATAEALAFGSLLREGTSVRLSGQDCTRGTFSQRHAGVIDQEREGRFLPLNHLENGQAKFEVVDSMLSEYAVLGFEYGYSLARPEGLALWEAQFGDFANGAQIMIDQFISSGEKKWLRMSGLVMLLPHGFEGQGPEHSSARLERFLQLSAENNWIVANCTTPANYFHILRRQMKRSFRKPLIIMTPKSLLRHPRCVSRLDEMENGASFHRVLWDDAELGNNTEATLRPDEEIRKLVLCSGKVYFDLLQEKERAGIDNAYVMRLEQLYPFPAISLMNEMARFPNANVVWCQEEPKNQGAWTFVAPTLEWLLERLAGACRRPVYVGRHAAASPATGIGMRHSQEHALLVEEALTAD